MELYVHVPFCVKKCRYCDFYSGPQDEETVRRYFDTLKSEISESPWSGRGIPVTSVFFGGGTPSAVKPGLIADTLNCLRDAFSVAQDAEITLEGNPGTFTEEALKIYRTSGINRLSIGLQSTDSEMLRFLGRIHTAEDFEKSYDWARRCGFDNISIDLMSSLPGETPESFEKGLLKAASYEPEHISVYSLIIEENTPFYALYGGERIDSSLPVLPSEDEDREIYHRTGEILSACGYERYEISNYARPGYRSRHNTGYWTGEEYLGFGASAASLVSGKRFRNARSLFYMDMPYEECETLSPEDRMAEFFILGLRMTEGVRDRDFRTRFGASFFDIYGEVLSKHISFGTLERENETVRLSAYGLDVANSVMADFLP